MKRNVLILGVATVIALFITSCFNEDDYNNNCEFLNSREIDSIYVKKDTINLGEVLPIYTYSQIKQKCEAFYTYDYQKEGNTTNVTTYVIHNNCTNCGNATTRENKINFNPIDTATYRFKFWSGTDEEGNNLFIEKNIVVVK